MTVRCLEQIKTYFIVKNNRNHILHTSVNYVPLFFLQASHTSVPKAAVLGAVFISNLLSKNKRNKDTYEAGYSDEEGGNG